MGWAQVLWVLLPAAAVRRTPVPQRPDLNALPHSNLYRRYLSDLNVQIQPVLAAQPSVRPSLAGGPHWRVAQPERVLENAPQTWADRVCRAFFLSAELEAEAKTAARAAMLPAAS
jgi:hypothetical protein